MVRARARDLERFQSTLSEGRATDTIPADLPPMVISIHALRGESDITPAGSIYDVKISIHALRGESD